MKTFNVKIYTDRGDSVILRGVPEDKVDEAKRSLRSQAQASGWARPWYEERKKVSD